jgi:hypothetical protein
MMEDSRARCEKGRVVQTLRNAKNGMCDCVGEPFQESEPPKEIKSEFPFRGRSPEEKNFSEPDGFCLLTFRA